MDKTKEQCTPRFGVLAKNKRYNKKYNSDEHLRSISKSKRHRKKKSHDKIKINKIQKKNSENIPIYSDCSNLDIYAKFLKKKFILRNDYDRDNTITFLREKEEAFNDFYTILHDNISNDGKTDNNKSSF